MVRGGPSLCQHASILTKIQGVSHGGGVQVPAGSDDFAAMDRFLALLEGRSQGFVARLLEGPGEGEPSLLFGVTTATPPWAEKVQSESTERRLIGSGIWPISREPMEDRPRAKALRNRRPVS